MWYYSPLLFNTLLPSAMRSKTEGQKKQLVASLSSLFSDPLGKVSPENFRDNQSLKELVTSFQSYQYLLPERIKAPEYPNDRSKLTASCIKNSSINSPVITCFITRHNIDLGNKTHVPMFSLVVVGRLLFGATPLSAGADVRNNAANRICLEYPLQLTPSIYASHPLTIDETDTTTLEFLSKTVTNDPVRVFGLGELYAQPVTTHGLLEVDSHHTVCTSCLKSAMLLIPRDDLTDVLVCRDGKITKVYTHGEEAVTQ